MNQKNAGNQTSMRFSILQNDSGIGDRSNGTLAYRSEFFMYIYETTRSSSGSTYREVINEYSLAESDDYIILNSTPLNMDNCPLTRKN